jgi:hypothetical protein
MRTLGGLTTVLFIVLLWGAMPAHADPFFNSAESLCAKVGGVPTNPDVLWCDDFEDGVWATTCNDDALAANKGWFLCNGASTRNPPPPAAACDGTGAASSCYAISTSINNDPFGGDAQLALHALYPSATSTYRELWARQYVRFVPGYVFNGNQKFAFSFLRPQAGGGIDYGIAIAHNVNDLQAGPQWDCTVNAYHNPQNSADQQCYLNQNVGSPMTMLANNHWYFYEVHIRLNDFNVRNGTLELWADDCGTSGVCSGTPTKRMNYTNVGWRGVGDGGASTPNTDIGQIFYDIWGNATDLGTRHFDQIVLKKANGPIGFINATPPPAAPTNLIGCVGPGCTPASLGMISTIALGVLIWSARYLARRRQS